MENSLDALIGLSLSYYLQKDTLNVFSTMDSLLNKMPGVAEVEYLISALESKGAFYSDMKNLL